MVLLYALTCLLMAGDAGRQQVHEQAATRSPSRTGREVYQAACAACHGPDGRGGPQAGVALSVPPADFTDCHFAPREPDTDWLAVTAHGGPARAFDRTMPAFGEALSPDEIAAVVAHVREFCRDRNWPRGDLNLPRPFVTGKAFPEDEAVATLVVDAEGAGSVRSEFVYEQRIGPRNQWEIAVPLAWAEDAPGSWAGGIGDIALGFKRAVYHNLRRGAILSGSVEVIVPTGESDRGLGGGTTRIEPFVAWGQILPRDSFLQVQAGLEMPTDRDRADEAFWRIAVGRSFAGARYGRTWSPMIELVAAREFVSGEPTLWDIVPEMQVTLSRRQHVMLNAGVRVPLNEAAHRPTRLMVYLLWDWFDGGFTDGW